MQKPVTIDDLQRFAEQVGGRLHIEMRPEGLCRESYEIPNQGYGPAIGTIPDKRVAALENA